MASYIFLILVSLVLQLSAVPVKDIGQEGFARVQKLATNCVEKGEVIIKPAKIKSNGNRVEVSPPEVEFGKPAKTDRLTALFQYQVIVEAVKKDPYPGIERDQWVKAVTKAGTLSDDLPKLASLNNDEFQSEINGRISRVHYVYVDFARMQGKQASFSRTLASFSVDFVTMPNDAIIHMVSVWDYELEAARGGDPDALLISLVVTPRTNNSNYAGDVYYKLERNGVVDPQKKGITIKASGKLPLP
jgi:hypothetical protein